MFTSPTSYDASVAQDTRRRRADAERNIEAILDAALRLFTASTNVSMTDIAHAAGVGRVTLYAHFPSREDLVDAVVERSLAESAELIQVDGFDTAPADEVLVQLVRSSWQALHRHRRIRLVAQAELGEQRLKARHERAEVSARLNRLIARGQDEGMIRSDLPVTWLVTTFFGILHAAADEVDAGWLSADDAPAIIEATLLPALLAQPRVGDDASRQRLARSRS